MSKEGKSPRELGFAGNMAIGCLLDIVLIVCFACFVKTDTLAGALAYATVLSLVVWGARWVLNSMDMLDGWCGRLIGPVVLVVAMLLAVFCPIGSKEAEDIEDPEPAKAERSGESAPPGVRYTPASTNEVTVEEALAELNGLVGLKPVKEEVARFVKFVRVAQQRKEAGLKVAPISYHMVFTGPQEQKNAARVYRR